MYSFAVGCSFVLVLALLLLPYLLKISRLCAPILLLCMLLPLFTGRMVEHQLDVSIGMSVLADSGAGGYSPEVINRFCSFHDIEVEVQTVCVLRVICAFLHSRLCTAVGSSHIIMPSLADVGVSIHQF